jgi:lysophospholipase L1-like esterase
MRGVEAFVNERKTVVFFGDSNTHGSMPMHHLDDVRRYPCNERWSGIVAGSLGLGWQVHEEGLPGRTTVHDDPIEGSHLRGISSVPVIMGTHTPIDVVVLALGVNDLKARFSVGPADIAGSIESVVRAIRASSATPGLTLPRIIIVSPPPILETGCLGTYFMGGRQKSELLPSHLRTTADRCDAGFIEAGAHVRSSEVDGIHWDADQQSLFAEVIVDALVNVK